MSESAQIPSVKRIVFFDGQRLTATDLADLELARRNQRWLHTRCLHSWGIGAGLDVIGEPGDSVVTIGPGYGVDCVGREIILTETIEKTVPSVAAGPGGLEAVYYLVASYRPDEDQAVLERRPGVCLPEGTIRLSEAPKLAWKLPDQLVEGLELVLAQVWIKNCKLSRPLSLAARRSARPPLQPYIGAGQTVAGATAWMLWVAENQATVIGVLAHVDISPARFQTTPHIMARVGGNRHFINDQGQVETVTGQAAVVGVTPHSFTLQMRTEASVTNNLLPSTVAEILLWHVVWVGIEGGAGP